MINNRQNGRRRGRGGAQVRGSGNGPDRGNRIDNRARGNAAQLHEKYRNLARDAQTQGDRVMTEYYLQFADHYFRVLNENRARFEEQNPHRRPRFENDEFEDGEEAAEGVEETGESDRPTESRRDDREFRRQDREPRRRDREPSPAPAPAMTESAHEDAGEDEAGESRRGRRGRRSRRTEDEGFEAAPQRIEIDRLPPAFAPTEEPVEAAPAANSAEHEEAEPAPRRRRTRRTATPNEDSTVAA